MPAGNTRLLGETGALIVKNRDSYESLKTSKVIFSSKSIDCDTGPYGVKEGGWRSDGEVKLTQGTEWRWCRSNLLIGSGGELGEWDVKVYHRPVCLGANSKNNFLLNFAKIFFLFLPVFSFLHNKCRKSKFWLAFEVRSNQTLVEIYIDENWSI